MLWVWRRCLIRFLLPAIACSCILPLASCSFSCFLASYSISCDLDSCLLASCSFASCFLPLLALAFCLLLFVPNVAFWTDKKPAPNCSLRASKTLTSPHWNTMQLKGTTPSACGCLCLTLLSEPRRNQLQIAAFKPPKPCPRHTETPCNWRTDHAFCLRLPALITLLSDLTRN